MKRLYTEDVRDISLRVTDNVEDALVENGIPITDKERDEIYELITIWVEDNFGRGEYRHQMD